MAHAQIDEYYIQHLHLLTRNEIIVFTYLLKKRNGTSKQCNPRLASIAKDTQLAKPRVSEAVKGLEAKNWIVWQESGEFLICEKVTHCVTTQVTNCVRKSYALRKSELRNAEEKVTQCVTPKNKEEQTKEQTSEKGETPHTHKTLPQPSQACQIVKEILNFDLPNHTQDILNAEIKEFSAWRDVLVDAKAGMDKSQRESKGYLGKAIQFALKDYRRAVSGKKRTEFINGKPVLETDDPKNPYSNQLVF